MTILVFRFGKIAVAVAVAVAAGFIRTMAL